MWNINMETNCGIKMWNGLIGNVEHISGRKIIWNRNVELDCEIVEDIYIDDVKQIKNKYISKSRN
jgi:hypothetical protein